MSSDQKNALIAIVLSGFILFGWQYFFAPPIPLVTDSSTQVSQTAASLPDASLAPAGPIEPAVGSELIALKAQSQSIEFTNDLIIKSMSNTKATFGFEGIVDSSSPFLLELAPEGQKFSPITFTTVEKSSTHWIGESASTGFRVQVELGAADFIQFKVQSRTPFKYRYVFSTTPKKLENSQERNFAYYDTSLNHWSIGDDKLADAPIHWAGIDFNYHLFGVSHDSAKGLVTKSLPEGKLVLFPNYTVDELSFDLVFLIKEYNYLTSLGRYLKHAIDFGFWGFFAEIILRGLQFFYQLVPNYGIAIIILTFVVRLITFPLQYKSFVSMKKMQLIQPELTKIKEKYKEDPMRLQKESMELFKRSGANPLGGCLPMVLQLPVFFAFYKVLYSAVELVNAPFFAWLEDLSNKDPYFVLPLLMTGAMFLQQKLTPTTVTDPVQKKVFMFMPIIFGFIMKDLPSGLSLYILTSTLLGIGQQTLVFKLSGRSKAVVV
jgi:YidC/Oxa1 family membrane protein insertase